MGDEAAKRRGVQKSVLERAAPPTFDVCVEMVERHRWRVHPDVGSAVDSILAGVGWTGIVAKPTLPSQAHITCFSHSPRGSLVGIMACVFGFLK